ncbi:MAG TPA: hypothetical protein VI704_02560 [Bacteroidota bacterium]|nr:hypothetical protein [Bacteroidota bacterium]
MKKTLLIPVPIVFLIGSSSLLIGNDRKFTYTYESSVLSSGLREIELWNTHRSGKNYFFRRIDQRIEYEFGLGGNVMSALYMNYSWRLGDSNGSLSGGTATSSYSMSVSSEWKYKMLDRVADPLGFALYGEATVGLDEMELEAKLIFDKQVGDVLFAFNIVAENEWATEVVNGFSTTASEFKGELDFGVVYDVNPSFSFGMEVRNRNKVVAGVLKYSALFAGPVVSFSESTWWATFTLLPQVAALKGATGNGLVLDGQEKMEARLLFSFHL